MCTEECFEQILHERVAIGQEVRNTCLYVYGTSPLLFLMLIHILPPPFLAISKIQRSFCNRNTKKFHQ